MLLHRFEFLNNSPLVARTLESLANSSPLKLLLVLDDHARHALREQLLDLDPTKFELRDKLSHALFVELITSASFVVTEGSLMRIVSVPEPTSRTFDCRNTELRSL